MDKFHYKSFQDEKVDYRVFSIAIQPTVVGADGELSEARWEMLQQALDGDVTSSFIRVAEGYVEFDTACDVDQYDLRLISPGGQPHYMYSGDEFRFFMEVLSKVPQLLLEDRTDWPVLDTTKITSDFVFPT